MSLSQPGPWERLTATPLHELVRRGPTGSLDWRRPIRASALPAEVQDLIHEVARRTRLWRSERHAVAEELVAHFADGLAAGATAESLTHDFGDPKAAAKLIRWAKRRNRPTAWHAWWWGSRGFAVAAIAYVAFGAYLLSARPTVDVDYVAMMNAPIEGAPDDEKAWPLYERLLLELDERLGPVTEVDRRGDEVASPLTRLSRRYSFADYDTMSAEQRAAFDSWLSGNADWIERVRLAASRPRFGVGMVAIEDASETLCCAVGWRYTPANEHIASHRDDPWRGWLFSQLYPGHVSRQLARLVAADFHNAVAADDDQRAVANLEAWLQLATQAEEAPLVLAQLTSNAIRRSAFDAIDQVLTKEPARWSDGMLQRIAQSLSRPRRPPEHFFDGELLAARDTIQRMFVAGGGVSLRGMVGFARTIDRDYQLFDVRQPAIGLLTLKALYAPFVWGSLASRAETVAEIERLHAMAVEESQTPLWERPESAEDAYFNQLHGDSRNAVLRALGPAYRVAIGEDRRVTARTEGVLIGLALEQFRHANGAWPESLDELAPRWMPIVPLDPITGGSLGYRVINGEPIVYSLGRDGDDDGGRLPSGMSDAASEAAGYSTIPQYGIGPTLTDEQRTDPRRFTPREYNGDWVLWSTGAERYMPAGVGWGDAEE